MGYSTPGFVVLHYCTEFDQTHIHWVSDAIQSFHSVTCFSSYPQSFPPSSVFSRADSSHQVAKVLEIQHQSFQWIFKVDFLSVQLQSYGWLFVTPWTAAHQASFSITNSQSLLRLMSIQSVMPSSHLIFYLPFFLHSIFPSIRFFFFFFFPPKESVLGIRWRKYWSFSFSKGPSSEYSGLISFRIDWFDLLAIQGTLKSLLQHHSSKLSIL